jgi:type VI secretion system secreted protein VgrG
MSNNAYEGAGGSEQSHFEVSVEAMPAQSQFRPRRSTPKPHTLGPETAVVVGPSGEEIYTNEHGQVKVKFFWDRYGKKDGTDSCWIRVSHPWAGMNYGGIHIPRINQEVIVDFLNGDPDYPIIIGRVYNADQKPPWGLPGNKTQSGFLTRSTKGGTSSNANAIRFEDKKGEEQLWVHAERNQDIEVEVDESHTVGHDRTKSIGNDETNKIGHDRKTAIRNDETYVVKATRRDAVGTEYLLEVGELVRIVCGETVIEMTKDGQLNIKCKNFNITADQSGKINTKQSVLDLNMDNRASQTEPNGQGVKENIVNFVDGFFQNGKSS